MVGADVRGPVGRVSGSAPPILRGVRVVRTLAVFAALAVLHPPPSARATAALPPPPVVASEDATEDATASNNQVKLVRTQAGLVLAYVGTGAGGAQVYLARSQDGGAHWSRLAQVSDGPAASRLPAIALDEAGRLHVMWTRYDDGVGKIYYRVWAGAWTGPQQRVSPPVGYAGYPGLAIDPAGHPRAVWYGIREGGTPLYTRHGSIYEIYYTGFDGRSWSDPILISTGMPDSVNPAIAEAPAGRVSAVWYQFDGRVYQVRYAERDGTWREPETVFRASSDEFNPDVAVDAAGTPSLVWERHADLASAIVYARRSGATWQGPVPLSPASPAARHPSITSGAAGVLYAAWDADDGQIYLRRYAGGWGPAVRLTADGGDSFPSVASDGADADVAWTHTRGGRSVVEYARWAPR